MSRFEFSEPTRKLIADRAGNRCSYPTCNVLTVGPGIEPRGVTRTGTAAHIYSASEGGPRGRGGLTEEEITSPENGIWLCRDHGKAVDDNQGRGHPSEVLLSYKGLQESRAQKEILGFCSPIGWIHEVDVRSSPVFQGNPLYVGVAKVRLGKLNLHMAEMQPVKQSFGNSSSVPFIRMFCRTNCRRRLRLMSI